MASISPHMETLQVLNPCTNSKVNPGQGAQVLKLLVAELRESEQSMEEGRMCGCDSGPPHPLHPYADNLGPQMFCPYSGLACDGSFLACAKFRLS